ncbi:MAG: hypothetical protein Q7K43_03500 [Candidatus Woesearchaeota archaeon]|nr:hypothetical protein [Candidatus Woesearchaeota archaeon]
MVEFRRIIVIFVIAILFSVFVQVSIDAIHQEPLWDKYCRNTQSPQPKMAQPFIEGKTCPNYTTPTEVEENCPIDKGDIQYKYDTNGCVSEAYCETCNRELTKAQDLHGLIVFIASVILGIIAIVIGLFLQPAKNPVNEWVGSGFLLGGLITIIIGTIRNFGNLGRYGKPVVVLLGLLLIIWLAYKKLGKQTVRKIK